MEDIPIWKKILLKSDARFAKTDNEIRYALSNLIPNEVPNSVLKDAYVGAGAAFRPKSTMQSFDDVFEQALKTRLAHKNVQKRGEAFSPTGADMFDLWNPTLQVPEYSAMPDLWSNKKAQ